MTLPLVIHICYQQFKHWVPSRHGFAGGWSNCGGVWSHDPVPQLEVDAWERYFEPLLSSIEPEIPPATAWRKIEQRIAASRPRASRLSGLWNRILWRSLGLIAASLVLALGLILFAPQQDGLGMERMMVVLNGQSKPAWIVAAEHQSAYLSVRAVEPSIMPKGKVCQLWMVSEGGRMIPLGTLQHRGLQEIQMPATPAPTNHFLVSREREDRIPTEKPSQELIFEGRLTEL